MVLFEGFPLLEPDTPWETGNQLLYERKLTDGLPVVLPTEEKIDRMLEAIKDKEKNYGKMPPGYRDVTPANVAYQAVMAGCRPEEFPVVLSAVTAALQRQFNLLGIQTTTGTPTTAVMLHGPVVDRLGANSEANCLGPGNRVNACIGRAVRLALTNLGAAYPGVMDMATMGQPGKYTFCFGESAKASFIPPFHVRKGLTAGQSAVTLIGVSGTVEVYDVSSTVEATMETLVGSIRIASSISSNFAYMGSGELFILVPPEVVDLLNKNGWDLQRVQQFIYERGAVPKSLFSKEVQSRIAQPHVPIAKSPEHIFPIVTGGVGIKMTYLQTWPGGTDSVTVPLIE
jgi:hypothetical protein